jgi:beta-glucosidase
MLEHYRRIAAECVDAGVEPIVTFHHFTSPRWIAAQGGWENLQTAEDFARYCERAANALKGLVRWCCTLNEPNAQVTSQVMAGGGAWGQGRVVQAAAARMVGSDRFGAFFLGDALKIRDVCLAAHQKSKAAIKSALPDAKVGMTLALQQIAPAPGGERLFKEVWGNARAPFYEAARNDDFIGVQTYNRTLIGQRDYVRAGRPSMVDAWGRDASPEALPSVIAEAHRETGLPVLVSENGINAFDDALRVNHLRSTLRLMSLAIDAGAPVLGYIHWSLLDNYEWSSGYVPRFGLVAVNRKTFRRTPKPSLAAYRSFVAAARREHRWA